MHHCCTLLSTLSGRLALAAGDDRLKISLDRVIGVIRQTEADMLDRYRENPRGGKADKFTGC